jgi:hypothetical protein
MANPDVRRRRIWLFAATVFTVAAFASAAALPRPAAEAAGCATFPQPRPAAVPAASGPSLRLTFGSDGAVEGVRAGAGAVPSGGVTGGFAVRTAGGGANLLSDPGFEEGAAAPSDWSIEAPPAGTEGGAEPAVDAGEAHGGTRSVRIDSPSRGTSSALVQEVAVDPGTEYVLSAWIKGRDIRPAVPTAVREPTDPHSPVRVDVEPVGGGPGAEAARESAGAAVRTAYGYTGTSGWSRQFVGVRTGTDVRRVRVVVHLVDGSGVAWFDDVSLSRLFPDDWTAVRGRTASPAGMPAEFEGDAAGTDLSVRARIATSGSVVRVDGDVASTAPGDRAVQVRFALPVDATGWRWGDFARSEEVIEPGRGYAYLTTSSEQQTSRYPYGEISGPQVGLALGIPLSDPRIFRVRYGPGIGLSIEFDLGLSSRAASLGPGASFSFVAFAFDPAWGFRAATQAYYDLFPDAFAVRMPPSCQGAWFVAPPVYGLDPAAMGLGLDMVALGKAPSQRFDTWGTAYLRWDNAQGVAATAYNHHWAFYQPRPASAGVPAPAQAQASLAAVARSPADGSGGERLREEARAAIASASRDVNGRPYYEVYRDYLAWYQNLDPLPGLDWTSTVRTEQMDRALRLAAGSGGRLAGIHLDSTSGMRRWGAADDYDPRHWAAATMPLTFSYDSGLPAERGIFPMYGDVVRTADFVHARDMLLSANFNGDEVRALSFVGADRIDYFGLEQGLDDRATPEMSVDQFAMLKRTMADRRPVSTLDQRAGQGALSLAEVDRRLQENLFYGIFMGAWDGAAEADGRAGTATWTAAPYRALWARYAPWFEQLATAGWEPVTDATSSNATVWVERFGSGSGGVVYLTLHNATGEGQRTAVTVDLDALGLPPGMAAVEEITGARIAVTGSSVGQARTASFVVPANGTRLLRIEPAGSA